MFNNAGVTICGEVRDLTLDHWRRMPDVNLWGVIYGTTAAYQVMVKQGLEMQSGFKMAEPADCARAILRGVECNRAIIIDTRLNRLFWQLYRISPSLYAALMQKGVEQMRPLREESTIEVEETHE